MHSAAQSQRRAEASLAQWRITMHRPVRWATISCNKLREENRERHRLWLSFLPITDINNVHVTPNFHDPWLHRPISEPGNLEGSFDETLAG